MQYREIVAVTGMGGLFQLMASKADGVIVRSLADNATKFVPARLHNVTPLESIEIYTTGPNVRLHEVLQQINESKKELPNSKKTSDADIRTWFDGVYPNLDHDRVYTSDLKKMLKWFEILKGANLLDFTAQQEKAPEEEPAADIETSEKAKPTAATKAVKKGDSKEGAENLKPEEAKAQVAEKKKGDQTDLEGAVEGVEAAPVKKTAAKKTATTKDAEEVEDKPAKKTATKKASAAKKTSKKKDEEEG